MPGGNARRKCPEEMYGRKMTQVNSDSGKELTQAKTDSGKKCPEEMPGGNARRKCPEEIPGGNAWRKNDSGK